MAFSDRPRQGGGGFHAGPSHTTGPGKHAKSHRWPWLTATALVVVAVVAGVSVYLASQARPPQRTSTLPAAARSSSPQTPRQAARQQVGAAIVACRASWRAQATALDAADHSLAQWQTHVDAMNELVAGKISYTQATSFWARTRVGAMHRVRAFERADRAMGQSHPTCASPRGVRVTGDAAVTLSACVRSIRTREQALAAAKTAIATWRGHINDMEMLRTGQLSPTMAERMWVRSWHRGQRQLDGYRSLASRASALRC